MWRPECYDFKSPRTTRADWRWGWRRRRVYPPRAWADVPWHGQNKAFGFFTATLSIEAGVSGFTCFLFGGLCGQALWPHHLVSVSRRQWQSLQRTANGGWGETLRSSRAADELCYYRNNFSYVSINLWPLAITQWPLPLVQTCINIIYCKSWWTKASYRSWFI